MRPADVIRLIRQELRPAPYRLAASLRVTLAAMLVMTAMLAFRMPLLGIGPYLAFLAMQRDRFFSRAALIAFFLAFAISSALLAFVTCVAWDDPWLRVGMFAALFYGGYYLMRTFAEPRLISGPLTILASVTYAYDEIPNPNLIFGQIGWLWAIYGLLVVAILLALSLLPAPSAHDLARMEMRLFLAGAERRLVRRAFGRRREKWPHRNDLESLTEVAKKAAASKALSAAQATRAISLGKAVMELATAAEENPNISPGSVLGAARILRCIRLELWRGLEPMALSKAGGSGDGMGKALDALLAVWKGKNTMDPVDRRQALPADFLSNREYGDFAMRASQATLFCYLFMTAAHWNGIHTCMVTCVITALVSAEARARKQRLRLAGALIGGTTAFACAIFVLPHLHDLSSFLALMTAGTFIGAWLANGSGRYAYLGLQFTLALYLMLLQSGHATDDLKPERDRWAGIVLGTTAMWASFAIYRPDSQRRGPDLLRHERS